LSQAPVDSLAAEAILAVTDSVERINDEHVRLDQVEEFGQKVSLVFVGHGRGDFSESLTVLLILLDDMYGANWGVLD